MPGQFDMEGVMAVSDSGTPEIAAKAIGDGDRDDLAPIDDFKHDRDGRVIGQPGPAGDDRMVDPFQLAEQGAGLRTVHDVGRRDPGAGVGRDLEDLASEIEQLMHRLGADVDQRANRLESLLREADQKIAELGRFQSQAAAVDTRRIDPPQSNTPSPQMTSGTDDPLARSIYVLADAGHDSLEIARRLKEHVGKVELILALRRG